MMSLLVVLGVILAAGLIFVFAGSNPEKKRNASLQALAHLLESSVEDLEGYDGSVKIVFQYKGRDFIFEDIAEKGFGQEVFRRALLKAKLSAGFTLGFTERDMTTVRDNLSSIEELRNPWMQNVGKVMIPNQFSRFNVFTNNNQLTSALFLDDVILKIFEKFKAVDSRGRPVMSLEIMEGSLTLKFHSVGGLHPSLLNLYNRVSVIEEYLDKMVLAGNRIEEIHKELKARNLQEKGHE